MISFVVMPISFGEVFLAFNLFFHAVLCGSNQCSLMVKSMDRKVMLPWFEDWFPIIFGVILSRFLNLSSNFFNVQNANTYSTSFIY